jgi:VWFA-related protein
MTAAFSQQMTPVSNGSRSIHLNIVVTPKSGQPVTGLQKQDFSLTDNKSSRPITSFKAAGTDPQTVKVILVIDAVNSRFMDVARERVQIDKFLRLDNGKLAHPTTIAVVTDKGTQILQSFSSDGNALGDALNKYAPGLRTITRNTGIWGADERTQISIKTFRRVTAYAASIPGRKMVLWVSPGWPLLSGVRVDLSAKQHRAIFSDVVTFSTQMRLANLTLYHINPLGVGEDLERTVYFQNFLNGVSNAGQTDIADISLQVLASQSGGLVLNGSTDIVDMLKKCLADSQAWYEITFDPASGESPNEYHHIAVTVNRPGLTARTRDGYYAQR